MEKGKPSLSSGLDAILKLRDTLQQAQTPAEIPEEKLTYLSVHQLVPGEFQPRRLFDQQALEELATSIKNQGLIQPIIVRRIAPTTFEIIAGERRWRAAQLAGLQEVPVIIKNINDHVACAFSLVENIQRKDLNALEEAMALYRLHHEFQLSHEKIAESIGRSRVAVTNSLRLLTLPERVKQYLMQDALSMGHARALISLEGEQQTKLAELIIKNALSVRQTEELVRKMMLGTSQHATISQTDAQLTAWQAQLATVLGQAPLIKADKQGHVSVTLKFDDKDALQQWIRQYCPE